MGASCSKKATVPPDGDSQERQKKWGEFRGWLASANNGAKTTTEQQLDKADEYLTNVLGSPHPATPTGKNIKQELEQLNVKGTSSLVTWKGIRVGWLLDKFFQSAALIELTESGCELWFVRKVCVIQLIRRIAGASGDGKDKNLQELSGPFVDHVNAIAHAWGLQPKHQEQPIVGDATTFISYTGAYTLHYFIESLAQLDPNEYIWFDVFCVNQFAWTGKCHSKEMNQFRETFMDDLMTQIKLINRTALVLQEWKNAMKTLEQMWVLWEIFNTAQAGAELQVLLPHSQIQLFIDSCLENVEESDSILESLAGIDASKAHTDNDADREAIYNRMNNCGFDTVNSLVVSVLRDWLADQGKKHMALRRDTADGPSILLLNQLAVLLHQQGRLAEAEPLLFEVLDSYKKLMGDVGPGILTALSNLAGLLKDLGKFSEAETMYKEALKEKTDMWGEYHPSTLTTKNNLAELLEKQGRLPEAEAMYLDALEGLEDKLGRSHPSTLTVKGNFAVLLEKQGRFAEAEVRHREVLKGQQNQLGDLHPNTLATMNNLATLLYEQDKPSEAEAMFKEALKGMKILWGDFHPDTLAAANNLAVVLEKKGKLSEAEVLYKETLKGRKLTLGDAHPDTVATKSDFAAILYGQGKVSEAAVMYTEILEGQRGGDGGSVLSLTTLNNVALVLQREGRLSEAETIYRLALEGQAREGDTHPRTFHTIQNLASLLEEQEKLEEAEEMFKMALKGQEVQLGFSHTDTWNALTNLVLFFKKHGKNSEAVATYKEALVRQQNELGGLNRTSLATKFKLAILLHDLGTGKDWEIINASYVGESKELLDQVRHGSESLLGNNDPNTTNAKDWYHHLFEKER